MKIFLSSLENNTARLSALSPMRYNLVSFYYVKRNEERARSIIRNSELVLVDSGAHTFQNGTRVDWTRYTEEYAAWIRQNDCDTILGYFEMDVDNVIGYPRVLELRRMLETVTDKIIPVWHKNRGIADFKQMCQRYRGKIIAITGFKNEDIRDDQYMDFLRYAWRHDCRIHCLGMTRRQILDRVPFDFVDSSTWTQCVLYGHFHGRKLRNAATVEERRAIRKRQWEMSYADAMRMQARYEMKWLLPTMRMKEALRKENNCDK